MQIELLRVPKTDNIKKIEQLSEKSNNLPADLSKAELNSFPDRTALLLDSLSRSQEHKLQFSSCEGLDAYSLKISTSDNENYFNVQFCASVSDARKFAISPLKSIKISKEDLIATINLLSSIAAHYEAYDLESINTIFEGKQKIDSELMHSAEDAFIKVFKAASIGEISVIRLFSELPQYK